MGGVWNRFGTRVDWNRFGTGRDVVPVFISKPPVFGPVSLSVWGPVTLEVTRRPVLDPG